MTGWSASRCSRGGDRLAYGTDEAVEGRDAFLQKRDPDWSPYPYHY
jgi:1,4-dihydroxy-2-naphthoyl-CoA synthase